ncbi:GntR family transcriptional regulator [Actinomycetospora sp. CA-101289]|uniref:GntR family transcriptional regulator n=1 Tax=Actinomycetospora sp. CA-101289 TaxID=3239893 RepID=UPI003D999056
MSSAQRLNRAMPVSEQIAADIRERIARGEYQPGDLIPSERDITEEWGVAKMTASRAVGRLKSAGLVEPVPGRGLTVLGRRAAVGPMDQLARMHETGRIRLPNEETHVLETGTMDALKVAREIVSAIGHTVQSGSTLYRRRLIYRDGRPLCLCTSWFADTAMGHLPLWPEVRRQLLSRELIPGGTAKLVAEAVAEDPSRVDYWASAEVASSMEAEHLRISLGAPVLNVFATSHGQEWPLECGVYTYAAGQPVGFPSEEYRV